MSAIRAWLGFLALCIVAVLLTLWAEQGTSARPVAALQGLYQRVANHLATVTDELFDRESAARASLPPAAAGGNSVGEQAAIGRMHTGSDRLVCGRPPTRDRTDTGQQLVYRWTDESGQTHMADKPPPDRIAEVMDLSGETRDFTIDIQGDGFQVGNNFQGQVAAASKRMYDTWHYFLGKQRLRQSSITLRIIGGPDRYQAFRAKALPDSQPNNGFYRAAENIAYVQHDPRREDQTRRTAFHEISHLITASHLGPTAPWLTEGLAEYFETMTVRDQSGLIATNASHLKRLRTQRVPDLSEYLALAPEKWYGPNRDLHYAMAWSLVHFMMQDPGARGSLRDLMQEAHAQFCKPFSAADALARYYPGGLQRLTRDWHNWLQQRAHLPLQT